MADQTAGMQRTPGQWAAEMRELTPHICWASNGVSACLYDAGHDGPHAWEPAALGRRLDEIPVTDTGQDGQNMKGAEGDR